MSLLDRWEREARRLRYSSAQAWLYDWYHELALSTKVIAEHMKVSRPTTIKKMRELEIIIKNKGGRHDKHHKKTRIRRGA